eukprot:CAMPEP_0176440748 /NCGR_PEP_ID=MMETSP0127-20121128/20765_1 /TAXON_ID=938130 /ORGANISM="Platyophrya macrostoma, Strain WH" /LENGTH=791 /DNA_ID=CAMNT_0017825351 /DNA_START=49 /DNA_END=2424 /DNA_ORIENTATION=+
MQRTVVLHHKSGRLKGFLLKDPALTPLRAGSGSRSLKRQGVHGLAGLGPKQINHRHANAQYQHAFPLLSHDDMGNSDQSNNTKLIQYSMYMPKRNKGTAPWFRGADTYSVKYSEQGRYEYQRYLMINRFPSEYKKHFMRFLGFIKSARKSESYSSLPQEALHWLLRMIVDNFNPQHVHYQAAMASLLNSGEFDMARDAWKIMERQQTIPCNATISTYLDVCLAAKEPSWALEAWNRYCTELRFLEHGEVDPKPVSRTPFSLDRDELLYLPKWKKHFDHDPNLDVVDLNRFNKTRELYMKMSLVMLSAGDVQGFHAFFDVLEKAMLETPTPVPEPPNPHMVLRPRWSPYERTENVTANAWRMENVPKARALGEQTATDDVLQHRFYTNEQFLVHVVTSAMAVLVAVPDASMSAKVRLETAEKLLERLRSNTLKTSFASQPTESLMTSYLQLHRVVGKESGALLRKRAESFLDKKRADPNGVKEMMHATAYLAVLQACADEGRPDADKKHVRAGFDPRATMATLADVMEEMHRNVHVPWTMDMHLAVVETMVFCGTMKANEYFVQNVLRKFRWSSAFLEALYVEYRRHDDVDMWAELTKRALVWTARYDVKVSEALKRAIEDDYDVIQVQTRTFRELAVFQFRDVEEKRHAKNPVNELPNPWIDYVSHALPFPDRDGGHPDEYGDLGQWRAPGGPGSPTKGPGYYAPKMDGEHLKGYTSEWRDLKNPMKPPAFPNPWERKYKQYARGQHPSYDMVYAGPMPEIFPGRHDFRKPTRWDFHDIEKQGKFRCSGPW